MTTLSVRLDQIRRESADINSFVLVDPVGRALPPFTPGCHIDVRLRPGLIRQYSLTNGPDERDHYAIAVKREPRSRGGSAAMHDDLRVGSILTVGAPRNNFALADEASHSILLAGGVGVTPLISMAKHLCRAGRGFELHLFARSPEHAPFAREFSDERLGHAASRWYMSEPADVTRKLAELLGEHLPGTHLYLCGPGPFMEAALAQVAAWPKDTIHLEHFAAPATAAVAAAGTFEVTLARRGGTFVVPAHCSIVQALAEAGIDVEVSCEQGICGTCRTGVLDGIPDHRDSFLTDDEKAGGRTMTPCVSRAKTPHLLLDL